MNQRIEIIPKNIAEPPEKMKRMYEAVSELLLEQRDLSELTVREITQRAGIGKGTAYEYFTSKEEIIAHALMYEYSAKIQSLAELALGQAGFCNRIFCVMDWLEENRSYHRMFTQFMKDYVAWGTEGHRVPNSGEVCELGNQAFGFIRKMVDQIMEDAYNEGVIREQDRDKRALALLGNLCQYGFLVTSQADTSSLPQFGGLDRDSLRTYFCDSICKILS